MALPFGMGCVSDLEMRQNPTAIFLPDIATSRWI